jgi:hypothetical protein
MKTKLLLLIITTFFLTNSYSQEQCGTMKNLEEQIKKDPSIKERMLQIEKQNQEWIEKNGRGFKKHSDTELNKNATSKSSLNTNDLCGYNNTYFTTITAPSIVNSIVSPNPNCTYGGEYVRVNNLIAGRTYRISTIGVNNFDTQITIYRAGGTGGAVAFNDDWQTSTQSEIYFTPIYSGNYDILINKFGCLPTSSPDCASLEVELWYIPRQVITIPVVVHVIHNDGELIGVGRNISDTQIQSQIDVLNEDYRRLNLDILTVPAPFRGESIDPLIQFCLAQQDPNGYATNGINRYTYSGSNALEMSFIDTNLKPQTIWNRDKYLNLWTLEFGGADLGTLGYAEFPGLGTVDNDGVVIRYDAFGKVGNLANHYNLGRTATHEVGHWLNLKHIWGDADDCVADDEVIDTPLQGVNSNAIMAGNSCPSFPIIDSCTSIYPGIMFMNYMDYGFHECKKMYTFGQFARTDATLFNQRIGLLTSQGCNPGILGNNQFEKLNIIIYPNPTSSKVFFDNTNSNFKEVAIYNYLGQEVAKTNFTVTSSNQEIDMNSLATGVYVLKFSDGENSKSVKVIKQ